MITLWTPGTNGQNGTRRRKRGRVSRHAALFPATVRPVALLLVPLLLAVSLVVFLTYVQVEMTQGENLIDRPHRGVVSPEGLRRPEQRPQINKHTLLSDDGQPRTPQLPQLRGGEMWMESKSINTALLSDGKPPLLRTAATNSETDHVIPKVLVFTHSIDLLLTTAAETTPAQEGNLSPEDLALQRNVHHTIQLHDDTASSSPWQVRFLTDDDCLQSIRNVLGNDTPLVSYFQQESHGMYKADICRGAALYETGGLYFDVDIEPRMNVFDVIHPNTTFVTSLVHVQSKYPHNFFQAFIGTTKHNPILLRYLELFVKYYEGHVDIQGPLGVLLLRKAYDDVVKHHSKHHNHGDKSHSQDNDDESTSSPQAVELWQEVLYSPKLFPNVPPPSWGTRRACHFVVVSNKRPPFVVPLYSRTRGSRMCGGAGSTNKASSGHVQKKEPGENRQKRQ